ncbi:YkgJ family cysteine cluster protein [Corallococcus sp. CA047B]|uniref:YkgJ family cysteine cluster protein n=1 Tax=Corallococcus sp. CA047B TaxID=2316729 RepID=UPI001F48AEA6|nr:YkgJ family cysteine cluster protein [Corallococcus sp. CA047B]
MFARTGQGREGARPYTCPLLDREPGACRVYAHRPLALHGDADVLWANQDALEDAVARLGGATRPLFEGFAQAPSPDGG